MPGNINGEWDTLGLSHVKPKVIPVIQFDDRLGFYFEFTFLRKKYSLNAQQTLYRKGCKLWKNLKIIFPSKIGGN